MSLETDAQWKRLCELYADKGDEELLEMDARREDLTEVAQQALAHVMEERGLAADGAGTVEPEGSAAVDAGQADELGLMPGEVVVCVFDDAFRAQEAVRVVTEAGISCRVMDLNAVRPRQTMDGAYLINLGMIVAGSARVRAARVLSQELKFPEPEGADGAAEAVAEPLGPVEDLGLLSMFSRAEGLLAARALGEAGISYVWRDGKDGTQELPDEDTVAIEVGGAQMEEALKAVEAVVGPLEG
jgi:hypothetical protein